MTLLDFDPASVLAGPVRDWVPLALKQLRVFGHEPWQWLGILAAALVAYPVGRLGSFVLGSVAHFFAKRTDSPVDDALAHAAQKPLRLALFALVFREATEWLELSAGLAKVLGHAGFSMFLLAFAWFCVGVLSVFADWAQERVSDAKDEVKTRAVRTQIILLRRIATAALVIITIAMFLLQFELVRSVGLSLLASAGIVGVVIGLAAQKTIGGVISGIQISLTQPIRIGDTVLVDKESGSIEEINLTYIVIKLSDGRRQIVPIARFIDQTFENWTKTETKLSATVAIPVDFRTPIEKVRPELARLCKDNPRWDGRVAELRISDATENAMIMRATVSAADPDAAAGLKLDIREGLIKFLRELDGGVYLLQARTPDAAKSSPTL